MAEAGRRFAIITDDPGWHGRRLADSIHQSGHAARFVRLQDCHFNLDTPAAGLELPGFSGLPDGVFVRGIPGGSLEQVVYYLDVLHALEYLAVPVFNNARAIEKSVDKGMASFLLKHHGIPTPESFCSSDLHYINEKLREGLGQARRFVLKPLFGSQGKGLQLIENRRQSVNFDHMRGVVYVQEYIDAGHDAGVDFRVFVIGGRVVASMQRTGRGWITNVAQGGRVEAIRLSQPTLQMAIDAARITQLDYAGVDLIQDRHGRFWVTEVNSVPAWKGLQQTTCKNLSKMITDTFIAYCLNR